MTVRTLSPFRLAPLEMASFWFRQIYRTTRNRADCWAWQRRVARSRRAIESLPDHIRQDIGWPAIEDRLPSISRH